MPISPFRWLHISDLHVGKDYYGQEKLFQYICNFVAEKSASNSSPDFVFITGDIANKGKIEEYERYIFEFLTPLSNVLGRQWESKIFTVPGNHDVDRDFSALVDWHTIPGRLPKYLDPKPHCLEARQDVTKRFKAFADCDVSRSGGHWLCSTEGICTDVVVRDSRKIGILRINTAWFSQSDGDEGKLDPGKNMVEDGLSKLVDCNIRIVLGHHSVDWFRPEIRSDVKALFGRNHVIYLHGDLHENEIGLKIGGGFPFLDLQAAAAFQERESTEHVNGIMWCELRPDTNELSVQPFIWSKMNQEWSLSGIAIPERYRKKGSDTWVFPLPGSAEALEATSKTKSADEIIPPPGWWWIDKGFIQRHTVELTKDRALRFFDGSVPGWEEAISPLIPRRGIVRKITESLNQAHEREELRVTVLIGPSGEGRSTALSQIASEMVGASSQWKVMWRGGMDKVLPSEFLLELPQFGGTWLIVSDEAHEIAQEVCESVRLLHSSSRRDIQFLLSTRDTDWTSAQADDLPWPDNARPTLEQVKGLSFEDAEKIVEVWSKFGNEGMGRLANLEISEAATKLAEAAEEELLKDQEEGSFLGAMLKVRKGADIKNHVASLLYRLDSKPIRFENPNRSPIKLLDAFAYIAVVHSDKIIRLPKAVLSQVMGIEQRQIKRLVIGPLGDEAAATLAGNFVITRHRTIAQTAVQLLSSNYHIDVDEIYRELVRAALDAPSNGMTVINLSDWKRLPRKFYEKGRKALGLQLASDLYNRNQTDHYTVVTYSSILRDSDLAMESANIFRNARRALPKDRPLYLEWAASEAKLDRTGISIWLAGVALADETEGTLDYRTAMICLSVLCTEFQELFRKVSDSSLIGAAGAAAHLGLLLPSLDERALETFKRGCSVSQRAGVQQTDLLNWISTLQQGVVTGWQKKETPMPIWVTHADNLEYTELKQLLQNATS